MPAIILDRMQVTSVSIEHIQGKGEITMLVVDTGVWVDHFNGVEIHQPIFSTLHWERGLKLIYLLRGLKQFHPLHTDQTCSGGKNQKAPKCAMKWHRGD